MLSLRVGILALTAMVAALLALVYRPKRHFLRDRAPDRNPWLAIYDDSRLSDVGEVLGLVQHAFSLPPDDVFQLRPEDRLLDIYREKYPHGGADDLELEGLIRAIRKRYGVALATRSDLGCIRDVVEVCLESGKSAV